MVSNFLDGSEKTTITYHWQRDILIESQCMELIDLFQAACIFKQHHGNVMQLSKCLVSCASLVPVYVLRRTSEVYSFILVLLGMANGVLSEEWSVGMHAVY